MQISKSSSNGGCDWMIGPDMARHIAEPRELKLRCVRRDRGKAYVKIHLYHPLF